MLQIIHRYLLRELTQNVAGTALVLLVITVGGTFADILQRVARGRVPAAVMFPVLGLRVLDALTVLLPVALFLGVMMGFARLYRDSEMHVLGAAGMGAPDLLKPTALLAVPVALLTAFISLWLGPLAVRTSDAMVADANRSIIAAGLEPGRFVELPGHAGIIFVDRMSDQGTRLEQVFIASQRGKEGEPPQISIVTAAGGQLYHGSDAAGRYLALRDGHRYEGILGRDDWKRMHFARNEVAITTPGDQLAESHDAHALPTPDLWTTDDIGHHAELAWRISAPVSVLVLALLALALSRQGPREARYGRLMLAVLAYLLYANVLSIARAAMVQGQLPPWLGLWWVHALVLALAVWVLWRQYRVPSQPQERSA